MSTTDHGLCLLVMLIWGLNFVVAKLGIQEIPPVFLIALRFALVALILLPFVQVPRALLGRIVLLSLTLGGLHFSLMFTALLRLDASTAAVIIQLQVPFAALLSWLVLGETLGLLRLMGMGLAFGGIVIMGGEPRIAADPMGLILVLAAALVWALANIQVKFLGPIDGFTLNAWMALLATPQLLLSSWLLEEGQWQSLLNASWLGWGAILYMAVGVTIVGYGLWYRLLGRYPVSQLVPFTLLVPVIGVITGVVLLGEPLSARIAGGSAVTVLGVAVIVLPLRQWWSGLRPTRRSDKE